MQLGFPYILNELNFTGLARNNDILHTIRNTPYGLLKNKGFDAFFLSTITALSFYKPRTRFVPVWSGRSMLTSLSETP